VQDTADLAASAWQALADREPVCLVSDLDGPHIGRTTWFTLTNDHRDPDGDNSTRHGTEVFELFDRGVSTTAITTLPDGTQALAHALWPTPRLVVVGDGLIAAALQDIAAYLGWDVSVVNNVNPALAAVQALTPADAILILTHDHAVGGPVLQAGLTGRAGYVGALGSRPMQQARAQWLIQREVLQSEIDRVRGPAGLDIGAGTPRNSPVHRRRSPRRTIGNQRTSAARPTRTGSHQRAPHTSNTPRRLQRTTTPVNTPGKIRRYGAPRGATAAPSSQRDRTAGAA
jgi:xanthine dehydrogenase accessory factor